MTTSLQKRAASSATLASATTAFTRCSTSSRPPVTRKAHRPFRRSQPLTDVDRLREIDIELMRRLSTRVNVIPCVGKADSCTPTELKTFKKRVRGVLPAG